MKALASLTLLAVLLQPAAAGAPAAQPIRDALLKRFDLDKDGKLNAAEMEAAKAARAKRKEGKEGKSDTPMTDKALENPGPRVLEKFDADKDGKLSDSEKQAAREAFKKRADANQDGKVDKSERVAAGEAMKAAVNAKKAKPAKNQGKGREAVRAKILERFDEDKDGQLNEAERTHMRTAIQNRKANS